MQHIDDDMLALLALQDEDPDADTAAHLHSCARCRDELAGLARVVRAGHTTGAPADLTPPPDRVWEQITRTLRDSGDLPPASTAPEDADPASEGRPPTRIDQARATPGRGSRRRSMPSWLAVAAGVAIGVAGTGIATNLSGDDTEQPARQVVAAADLDAFGDSGTPGTATVYRSPDGRVLELTLDSRAPGQGFREVWLLDAASGELVSLGVLNGTEATLSVPDGLELADYPVVDVSREPLNGDPAHSGDSIARGKLDQSDPEPDA